MDALLTQWRRLILPPAIVPIKAGEQLPSDNRYPNAAVVDLAAHLAGTKTYAINLAYTDPATGSEVTRAGVVDIDDGVESFGKAQRLCEIASAQGLTVMSEWSGGKGCHVWLFSEPVLVDYMAAALRGLKTILSASGLKFKGELAPGDVARVKLAPAWHQVAKGWAYFYPPEERPAPIPTTEPPAEFLAHQARLLAGLQPTSAATLIYFAQMYDFSGSQTDPEKCHPHLEKLVGKLPQCIQALLDHGPNGQGHYDRANLTLARYCQQSGLSPEAGLALAERLADSPTNEGFTTKDRAAKLRHWESIQNVPAVADGLNCLFMLADKTLTPHFVCGKCAARPEAIHGAASSTPDASDGVASDKGANASDDDPPAIPQRLVLEHTLTLQLLGYALATDEPLPQIVHAIFSTMSFNMAKSPLELPVHGLLWRAISDGCRTPAAVANWLDRLPASQLVLTKAEGRKLERDKNRAESIRSFISSAMVQLVETLRAKPPLAKPEAKDLIARAVDMSTKAALVLALDDAKGGLLTGRDVASTIQSLSQTSLAVQRNQGDFGRPLEAYASELLGELVRTDVPAVPTPFPTLNSVLGGGLLAGRLYVLGAPPGAGKTTLAAQCADHAASLGIPAAFVAFEMGRNQLFTYALARHGAVNSARVEAREYRRSAADAQRLATVAASYLKAVGSRLAVIEGDYFTTAAKLAGWVAQVRARRALCDSDPVLIIVDYLQLMNSGIEELDTQQNEVSRISQVAVQLKQLARQTGAAVLALSDINRVEQTAATKSGQEFTLGAYRGSNRIGHAADVAMVLYSEQAKEAGGKAVLSPWDLLADKLKNNGRATEFLRGLEATRLEHPLGGDAAAVQARLELIKNRGGRGRGDQLLIYERAYHRFQPVEIPGQASAEGRG